MGSSNLGAPPSIDALFAEWWGGPPSDPFFTFDPGTASNLIFGGNPVYQIADFLAFYPKFGSFPQAIQSFTFANAGQNYQVNDLISPTQGDASGATIKVGSVDNNGAILTATLATPGSGYSVASALPTTGGNGTGATVNITAIIPGTLQLPQLAIQTFINLASACLSKNRWQDNWLLTMHWFVAHFCTLYLLSEGNPTSTPGQIAITGLTRGIAVSKSAGDVSVNYETVAKDLEGYASWNRTEYGQQLASFAKFVGMGPMYIW